MSAALDSHKPSRLELLLEQCTQQRARRPVFERLRDRVGGELARVLVFALSAPQRRTGRRGSWRP